MDNYKGICDKILAKIITEHKDLNTKSLESFAEKFLANLSLEDITSLADEDIKGSILEAFQIFVTEKHPAVKFINPKFELVGWQSDHSIICIHHKNLPFLVDSLRIELANANIEVHRQVNMVLQTERDLSGRLMKLKTSSVIKNTRGVTSLQEESF